MTEQRRLAAIVAADVVGYARLMGRDEAGTVARLRELRKQHLEPALARHRGRLVKLTGDGALVEFSSAVGAVSAAIEFQQAVAEANKGQPTEAAIQFRIGIHLGDLIVDGDDLYGDGVNVAARLEAQAPAGGILISRTVHEAVEGRLQATFDDVGDLTLKNIERLVRAFSVNWEPADWPAVNEAPAPSEVPTSAVPEEPSLALPDKPSIAVLPFQNLSGDPAHEPLIDGITEDIITELSRFRSLFVIARNSTFTYKGRATDVRLVGRELGVHYVLEGSIRLANDRIRVTAQLVDAQSGGHIWAERYDRVLSDIFIVQEEITRSIVARVAPEIEEQELTSLVRRPPEDLSAYEMAVRARDLARSGYARTDTKAFDQAVALAESALAADPGCFSALAALAFAHWGRAHLRIALSFEQALAAARGMAERTIDSDRRHHFGYHLRGLIELTAGNIDGSIAALSHALDLNPNDASNLGALGWAEVLSGDAEKGREHLLQAVRLNPRDYFIHTRYNALANASFVERDYAGGIKWGLRSRRERPDAVLTAHMLVLNYVGAGQIEQARAEVEIIRRLSPDFLRERLTGSSLYVRARDREKAALFLRIAAGLEDPSAVEALR